MRIRTPLALAGLVLLTAGCAGVDVHSDWDRAVEFGAYETYRWAPSPAKTIERDEKSIHQGDHSLLDRRIRRLVDEQMTAKGYRALEKGDADFLLVYHISTKRHIEIWNSPYPYWYSRHANRWREGTLLIEVVDLSKNVVVWQGWGTAELGGPDENEGDMRKVITKILERFPPLSG
jgi:hypothetical protein